jgi:hypothetical protein
MSEMDQKPILRDRLCFERRCYRVRSPNLCRSTMVTFFFRSWTSWRANIRPNAINFSAAVRLPYYARRNPIWDVIRLGPHKTVKAAQGYMRLGAGWCELHGVYVGWWSLIGRYVKCGSFGGSAGAGTCANAGSSGRGSVDGAAPASSMATRSKSTAHAFALGHRRA